MVKIPRILIAAPASGHGKTMITISLMAALHARGLAVAPNKVGPDYIDPGYHSLATGRLSRNLDAVMCPRRLIAPLLAHGALVPTPADIAIIEGVMGLFDGRMGFHGEGSAADIAALTNTPVIICADASHTSRTIAATVAGLAQFDKSVHIAGVIFNKVSSTRQADEIRDAMARVDIPILGFVPRNKDAQAPSRHLGLVPVEERGEAADQLRNLADLVSVSVDLDRIVDIAQQADDLDCEPWDPAGVVHAPSDLRPVVAMAGGRAFTFRYSETAELLRTGGCEVVEFDPTSSDKLPEGTCGIYIGGGFPQVHAADIASNQALLADVRQAVAVRGIPTVAECAGLLYLASTLNGQPMAGVLDADCAMESRLTMGYRVGIAPADTLLAPAGTQVIGHEFHRTQIHLNSPADPAWMLETWSGQQMSASGHDGISADPAARGYPSVHASYLHTHWAGYPVLAQSFIDAVHNYAQEARHGV